MKKEIPDSPPRLLFTSTEAAKVLGICPRSLWELTKNGSVKCVRLGGIKRYSLDDLKAAIKRMTK